MVTYGTIGRRLQIDLPDRAADNRFARSIESDLSVSPVTAYTHPHRQGLHLGDAVHLIDLAMTLFAIDPGIHMPAVIEDGVRGKAVHPHPFDRPVLSVRGSQLPYLRRIFENLSVAVHADRCRWNACYPRLLCRGMAIEAVDPVIARMNPVREVDRLHRRIVLLISKAAKDRTSEEGRDNQKRHHNRDNLDKSQAHILHLE
jgi:hypothetical protein